jgi:hypothetical protein
MSHKSFVSHHQNYDNNKNGQLFTSFQTNPQHFKVNQSANASNFR